jgi:acetylornithine deacetylase/succinyl-diaminopimelate desuccinylase-like protein
MIHYHSTIHVEVMKMIDHYLEKHFQNWIEELKAFLRIRSISTHQYSNKQEMNQTIHFLKEHLWKIGFSEITTVHTDGYPIIIGNKMINEKYPTVLVYGHYDVQPEGDMNLWKSHPFCPEIRNGCIYSRGAADDKGQLWIQLKAIQALHELHPKLPVNFKLILEGEEEIGSTSLKEFLLKEKIAADYVVISDTAMLSDDVPSICYGLRGSISFEIIVQGPNRDLHSGSFYGGAVQNPIFALLQLLQSMKSKEGKILIKGFYEDVEPIKPQEKEEFEHLPFDLQRLKERIGVSELFGEPGYSYFERIWTRPTLEVTSITGGSQEKEKHNVIPSIAKAKMICRLVLHQKPTKIKQMILKHIKEHVPVGVTVDVYFLDESEPYVLPIDTPLLQMAKEAFEETFEQRVYFIRAGGSIPIVPILHRTLQAPILLLGFSSPTANVHGPNEHLPLDIFQKGVKSLYSFYIKLGESYAKNN